MAHKQVFARWGMLSLAIGCGALGVILGSGMPEATASPFGMTRDKKARQKEPKVTDVGVVPTSYGELVALSSNDSGNTLVFRSAENDLYLVSVNRSGQIKNQVSRIKRKY